MAKIRNVLQVIFAIFAYYYGNLKASQEISTDFTCKNGNGTIFYGRVCDGISDCHDGSDEDICEREAVLFYYTYEEEFFNCDILSYPVSNYMLCRANNSGYRILNVSAVYINSGRKFSTVVLKETSETERMIPQKDFSLKNIQIFPHGFETDVYYSEYTREVASTDPWHSGFISKRSIIVRPHNLETKFVYINDDQAYMFQTISKYVSLTRDDFIPRQALEQHNVVKNKNVFNEIKTFAVDLITSNVYFIIKSEIKVCDENFSVCISLPSKYIENPVLLTISQKQRLLFWIEQKSPSQFDIFKYPLDNLSKATCIIRDLKSPRWLTVDPKTDRIYWMDLSDDDTLFIYSATFSGEDIAITSPRPPISNSTSTFAAYNNFVYWPDSEQRQIWKCRATMCYYRDLIAIHPQQNASNISKDKFQIQGLSIDYHPSFLSKIKNTCNTSTSFCSHLCLMNVQSTIKCYCPSSSDSIPDDRSNTYCEDSTLLVTYGNDLYVVGLLYDNSKAPIVHKIKMNITSISTIAYNSAGGNIFLAEIGMRNIYSWIPRTNKLQLMVQNGPGTINRMKFENSANNLYWIDPITQVIKVMNADGRVIIDLIKGNSSYAPVDFTLIAATRNIIVLFVKNNSSIVMEQILMDGSSKTQKILYEDEEIDDIGHLSLHFMDDPGLILVLDKQTNKIKCFLHTSKTTRFEDALRDGKPGTINSISSIGDYLMWSEDNLLIRLGSFNDEAAISVKEAQNISLGLKKLDNSVLSMTPVSSQIGRNFNYYPCLENNGGCEGLCLPSSNKESHYSCFCAEGEILINGTSCQKKSPPKIKIEKLNSITTPNTEQADRTSKMRRVTGSTSRKTESSGSTSKVKVLGIIVLFLLVSYFGFLVARKNGLGRMNNFVIRFRPNILGSG